MTHLSQKLIVTDLIFLPHLRWVGLVGEDDLDPGHVVLVGGGHAAYSRPVLGPLLILMYQ